MHRDLIRLMKHSNRKTLVYGIFNKLGIEESIRLFFYRKFEFWMKIVKFVVNDITFVLIISDDFEEELHNIRDRYLKSGFPLAFINETIKNFKFSRIEQIIPKHFFEEENETAIFRLRLPFCPKNENLSRTFLKKLKFFIGDSIKVFIIWDTSKIRGLFPLKDKNLHPNCVIYEGTCSCGKNISARRVNVFILEQASTKTLKSLRNHQSI